EMQKSIPYLPQELWYRFPEHYAERLSPRVDAFASTALLVAMVAGEELRVRGKISPRLAYNLVEYRNIYHSWDSKLFQKVDISYEHLEPPQQPTGETGVATAFSGGVDSFYTLWAHLPQNQPIHAAQVTHGLFVHGLDLRLDDEVNYHTVAEHYSLLFEQSGLELLQAATNAYQFSEFRVSWPMFFGAPTIGAALLLAPWLQRFYVPSGMPSYRNLFPQGSSPLIDHLLSTENIEIVHHGASVSRYDKTVTLTDWSATYHKLRVCSDKKHNQGWDNCCACHKCYRTMFVLELLDATSNYNNFAKRIGPGSYLHWGLRTHLNIQLAAELRNKALNTGSLAMALWIQVAIVLSVAKSMIVGLIKKLLPRTQLYKLKRVVYHPESNQKGVE
ncbi:MAG: hypothetical protein IZT55_02255, partial [Anaerolineae bacterium]|nr:hypothetical protein [Anaerolineae bacterium]